MTLFHESESSYPDPHDNKYVVFKRADWERRCQEAGLSLLPEMVVKDAVVIRRQDLAAPPIFDAYASFYEAQIEVLEGIDQTLFPADNSIKDIIEQCRRVADYFHEQAAAAWTAERKFPT